VFDDNTLAQMIISMSHILSPMYLDLSFLCCHLMRIFCTKVILLTLLKCHVVLCYFVIQLQSKFSIIIIIYYYYYAAFNAPCVGHKADESQAHVNVFGIS